MRIVSPFLKRVLYPSLSAAGIFRHTSASGVAIVTYHGVLPAGYELVDPILDGNLIRAEKLRRQLRLLKEHYHVISPEDFLGWREGRALPPRAVLLTCDDGLLNCLTDMLPVLQQEAVRCLFFVTGASCGEVRTTLWYEDLLRLFLGAPAGRFEISSGGVTANGDLGTRTQRQAIWWKLVMQLSQVDADARARFPRRSTRAAGLEFMASGRRWRFGLKPPLWVVDALRTSATDRGRDDDWRSHAEPSHAVADAC